MTDLVTRMPPMADAAEPKSVEAEREPGEVEIAREYLVESAACCRRLERVGNREATTYCLEGFAGVALAQGQAELAARLAGGAQAIRDVISTPVWALLAPFKEEFLESLRDQLGDESFEAETAAGAEIAWERLLDLGVEGTSGAAV